MNCADDFASTVANARPARILRAETPSTMATSSSAPATNHVWKFYRIGGLDQVSLETGADLLALDQLDQKLWVALSCPVKGLELDEKTLALVDTDKDGRIRVPEILEAIAWSARHLNDVGVLLKGDGILPLSAFNEATPDGRAVLASAKEILTRLGKAEATEISFAEASDTAKVFAATTFNGDGVIVPDSASDEPTKLLIADILATEGGIPDRSGAAGIDATRIDTFFADCAAYTSWHAAGEAARTLGEGSAAAVAAIDAVTTKIEDFFARTRLASFDARSLAAVNRSEDEFLAVAAKDMTITAAEITAFPLARVEVGRPLPLGEGVNPAWADAMATLRRDAVTPVFGADKATLTEAEWRELKAKVAPYTAWMAGKAGAAVEKLGLDRVKAVLAENRQPALKELLARDHAVAGEYAAITNVEKLLRYARDFRTLLNNFVNFTDFYSPSREAVFQAGVLYLDSRSTELCIQVAGPSPLAAMSKAYIAYCDCRNAAGQTMKIAACFTQGDGDYLFVGRNGVFYDRKGLDWDATITAIVDNPISIRQAFWSPYKKFVRMIEEQVAKRAAAAEAASSNKLAAAAEKTANVDKQKPAEPAKKVDVGTVAALGVALGALTTAFGFFLGFFKGMPGWQVPLVFVAVILLISLPSMIIAALKLRQRTLGPILDANGWAINGRVRINIPFGTRLTERAKLPANAKRSLDDPYEDKEAARKRRLIIALLILALAAIGIRWDHNRRGHYFWQPAPVVVITQPEAEPATPETPVAAPAN